MTKYITRFAPSPTGNLHIGSARTALLNYIITKKFPSSKYYLRIEDTDKLRSKKEFTQNILDGLSWLGIKWENDIQIQSKRIERHQEVAKKLLEKKYAYKCNCTEEKLNDKREIIKKNKNISKKICIDCKNNNDVQNLSDGFVVRLKLPEDGELLINDKIQGEIVVKNKELDDFILLRKDQTPTYMLSVVVDDNDLGVNFIIRGDDHLNNAFRQFYIYKYLNWKIPEYAHIPLIHGEDGSKLSKRHGAVDVLEFKRNGYLKEAIINNLILLGWSPNNNEIIGIKEIIKSFEINKLSKSSSIFSYNKLNFFNNYYLRKENGFKEFEDYCKNHEKLKNLIETNKDKMELIFETYKKNLNNFSELLDIVDVYFDVNYKINSNESLNKEFKDIAYDFITKLNNTSNWTRDEVQKTIEDFLNIKKLKFPVLGKPLRYLLINSYNGPSISDIFVILGKKDSIDRLNQYIEKINYGRLRR
tara:strand:+ start:1781 stop:3199 length:1419 start_codon:yes stop_codon:yes gene_type:complete